MDNLNTFTLNSAQRDLWINYKLYPDLPVHSMCTYSRLEGNMDVDAFLKATRIVIQNNDSLQTRIEQNDEIAVQIRSAMPDEVVRVIDLSDSDHPEAVAKNWIENEFAQPIDLFQYPLYQFALLKCTHETWYWMIRFHHIINDGWGVSQFMHQIREQYKFLTKQQELEGNQYSSFLETIKDQNTYLKSDRFLKDQNYWKSRLKKHSGYAVYNSTDQRKEGLSSIRRHKHLLDANLLDKAYSFAEKYEVNILNVLLGLVYLIARRRTGFDDQVIGIPNLGRTGRKEKSMLGMFVNMQPFRFAPDTDEITFVEIVQEMKRLQLQDYRSHRLPYRDIYDVCEAAGTNNDLFEIIFSHQKQDYNPDLGTASGIFEVVRYGFLQSPLCIYLREFGSGQPLMLDIAYHSYKISEIEIKNISLQISNLMANLEDIAQKKLSDIEILTEEEQDVCLQFLTLPQTFTSEKESIPAKFRSITKNYADRTAISFGKHSLSYSKLDLMSNTLAHFLTQETNPKDRIAVIVERNELLPVILLGILKSGCTYVPIDSRYPKQRIEFMLEDAGISTVIADSEFKPAFNPGSYCVLDPVDMLNFTHSEIDLPDVNPSDTAYIIYTSGSTGQPKGVQVSHHNVVRLFSTCDSIFHFKPTDIWTLFHSYAFDFSVWELFGPLLTGGKVLIVPEHVSKNPELFTDLIVNQDVSILNQTPSAFKYLAPQLIRKNSTGKLRHIIFGGEKLDFRHLMEWEKAFGIEKPTLTNMYGITETTVHVTFHHIVKEEIHATRSMSLIGKPLPDLEILLLNEQQELTPLGQEGEIYVGGQGVSKGYLNRPDLNAEKFIEHPFNNSKSMYRTGDIAKLHPEGTLEFLGRIDRQVQVRGFRIEIGEVEHAILQHPSVKETTLVPYHSDEMELIAYILPVQSYNFTEEELRKFLSGSLPDYMIPAHFILMDKWPLNVNGKLDKTALPLPAESFQVNPGSNGSDSQLMNQIKSIWQQILGVNSFSPDANFFDLGGNSLSMIKLQKHLQEEMEAEVKLIDLYRYPTLTKLSKYLDDQSAEQKVYARVSSEPTRGVRKQRASIAANMRRKRNSDI